MTANPRRTSRPNRRDNMIEPGPKYMKVAISLALANRFKGGQGVGAVIVRQRHIISLGVTTLSWKYDPTCHAEVNAIRAACKAVQSRYLKGCVLYSTFEPCPMCASAAVWAKMRALVFGARMSDQTSHSHQRIAVPAAYIARHAQPRIEVHSGFLRQECLRIIRPAADL